MEEEELGNVTEKTEEEPFRESLLNMISAINNQIPLPMEDMVLMSMVLKTKPKVDEFFRWIGRHLNGEKLESDPDRILSAATRIGRGLEPND